MQHTLSASLRQDTGKASARRLRREGQIPAVCYGVGRETLQVSLDPAALRHLLMHSPMGHNTVIELQAGDDAHHVMVQDIQRDPVKRVPVHVDFKLVKDDDVVLAEVPVVRVGRAIAEGNGGSIGIIRRAVTLRCAVKDIPEAIEIDVTHLRLGERIKASELPAPPRSEVYFKSDYVVLAALRPRGVEEDEEVEEGEEVGEVEEVVED